MSEERELLRDTVAALVEKHASPAAVREAIESEHGYDESLWKLLCEQVGAAALVVPEELGGAGGELADAAVVLEELGKALVPTPLLGTTLAELALLAADEARHRCARAAGRGRIDRRGGLRCRLCGQRRHRRRGHRHRRRDAHPVDHLHGEPRRHHGPDPPVGADRSRRTPRTSAPIPAWPTPRRSWWPPSRSAPPRSAST